MKTHRHIFRQCLAALCGAALFSSSAGAMDATSNSTYQVAESDCYSIGQRVAAENGGTLAKASQADQGGQPVCIIVVLTPGKDGKRPRRTEIVVPQN